MGTVAAVYTARSSANVSIRTIRPALRDVSRRVPACSCCSLHAHCIPSGLEADALSEFDRIAATRTKVRKGDMLYRAGDRFASLYAVRSGSCKTLLLSEEGHEQVTGYHIPGEIVGTDGIDSGTHNCSAVALEDTEVCALPFEELEEFARTHPPFQHHLYRLLSREIARDRKTMLLLGTMRAEQRLTALLLDLAERYHALGYSSCEFVLRMTREEIGSLLGLKLETVSRLFSRFHHDGLIQVQGRVVKLLDRPALQRMVGVQT